jgi:hypothetical protein
MRQGFSSINKKTLSKQIAPASSTQNVAGFARIQIRDKARARLNSCESSYKATLPASSAQDRPPLAFTRRIPEDDSLRLGSRQAVSDIEVLQYRVMPRRP